jgi:hypothetical protein
MFPGVGGSVILVREEDADDARRVIAEYQNSPVTDDETAEVNIVEDPNEGSPSAG